MLRSLTCHGHIILYCLGLKWSKVSQAADKQEKYQIVFVNLNIKSSDILATIMKIKDKYKDLDGASVWEEVIKYVISHKEITTVTGISFNATFVGSCIFLKGGTPGTKRAERGEYLTAKDFIAAYDTVRGWEDINTGNVKPYIKRQQTPFIALLHCAGIIE